MVKRILVPVDGSEHADKALNYALDLADEYGADIEILNAISTAPIPIGPYPMGYGAPTPAVPVWVGAYSKELKASHEKMLSEALKKAKKNKPGLNISTKLVEGRPLKKETLTS